MAKRSDRRRSGADSDFSVSTQHFARPPGTILVLTAVQRQRLLAVATRLRLPARTIVYREGDPLAWIFVVGEGVLKSFRELPSGKQRTVAFLFPKDVFGLAEHGRYVNTLRTVTPATIYRIGYESLEEMLRRDPALNLVFLSKVTHKLREAQRQAVTLGRRDAPGRLAMFLKMLETNGSEQKRADDIQVPMSRTDIAEYIGLSLEAVSRAARRLALQGIVAFNGGHVVHIEDRVRFESLVANL
jgi:CRP/FNR family transcriptional regulator